MTSTQSSITVLFITLLLINTLHCQDIPNNRIDDRLNDLDNEINVMNDDDDTNPLADVAAAFIQGGNPGGGDLGGLLSNLIQSDGGKTIGNLFMGLGAAGQNTDATNQILSGIGAMLGNNKAGAALDPAIIGNVLSLMANTGDPVKKNANEDMMANVIGLVGNFLANQNGNNKESVDYNYFLEMFLNLFKQSGENPMTLIMSLFESFTGPNARKREEEHASHALLLPPLLEKLHLFFDHFQNTELYAALWRITGGEKLYNMFAVDGKFDFDKFFERLENKSFRRYWLKVLTRKLTDVIAVGLDTKKHKKYVHTIISLFNGFLKNAEFPKSTLFDLTRPTETLTNFFNYFFKTYLNVKIDSRQYVKPAVKYVEEITQLGQRKGHLWKEGLDSHELSNKLTDTINLEIIEPVARVYRAYRFVKREPECDKYVMCIINQEDKDETLSLPGLKNSLSKTASLVASWFLSQQTGISFWSLYSAITDEKDCSVRFLEKCSQFHTDELTVHTEYEHTEL